MVAKVAVVALPKKLSAYTPANLYPVIPRLVVLSPMIAGAFGPPRLKEVAESTKLTSGPLVPISKFKRPVFDLIVGVAASTNSLRVLPLPTVTPVSATLNEFNVPT